MGGLIHAALLAAAEDAFALQLQSRILSLVRFRLYLRCRLAAARHVA
jgi:hypothetical protein